MAADEQIDWGELRVVLEQLAVEMQGSPATRNDSVSNPLSGIGDPYFDRHESTVPKVGNRRMHEIEVDEQYESGRLARRLIESAPDDCTRAGWRFVVNEDDRADPVARDYRRLNARLKFREAHMLANLTGGAGIVIAVDDDKPLHEPIDLNSVRGVKALHVFDRFELRHGKGATQDLEAAGSSFDTPETYILNPSTPVGVRSGAWTSREIHASRVIRFEGAYVRRERRHVFDGWGQPLIDALWAPIRDIETVSAALASTIHEFKYGVLKVENLKWLLTGPNGEQSSARLQERLRVLMLCKSMIKALVLDADRESYETREINVQGLDIAYSIMQQNLSAASHMSLTKLFGQAPKGFTSEDATGQDNWDDHCMSQQLLWYYPGLITIAELVLIGRDGYLPDDYDLVFNPLRTPTDAEKAATYFTTAQADEKYVALGVLTEETLHTRFEKATFSVDLVLEDEDALAPVAELEAIETEAQADDTAPTTDPAPADLVSIRDAAKSMNVPTHALSALVSRGRLRHWRFGRHRQVSLGDVVALGRSAAQAAITPPAPEPTPSAPVVTDTRADADGDRWMLALVPPAAFVERLGIELTEHGLDPLTSPHVTLIYGGHRPAGEPLSDLLARVDVAIGPVVGRPQERPRLRVTGAGMFFDGPTACAHLLVSGPRLTELRAALHEALAAAQMLPWQKHGFIPHLTLAYFDDGDTPPDDWTDIARVDWPDWPVDEIAVVVEDQVVATYTLGVPVV